MPPSPSTTPPAPASKKKASNSSDTHSASPVQSKKSAEYLGTPLSSSRRRSLVRTMLDPLYKTWRRPGTPNDADEIRRVRELLLGSALRRFSLTHPAPLPKPGTLRLVLISSACKGARSSFWGGAGKVPKRAFFIEGELGAARAKSSVQPLAKGKQEVFWGEGDDRVLRLYFPGDDRPGGTCARSPAFCRAPCAARTVQLTGPRPQATRFSTP
jgi:hypothetical protein